MENKSLINQEWQGEEYEALVGECQDIIVEGVYAARQELIDTYKRLGERIIDDPLYKKFGKGSNGFIQCLTTDIGKGQRTIYYAIQFAEKLQLEDKVVCTAMQTLGKNLSWTKIKELLPAPKENKIELELPKGEYDLIVIDPPWSYGTEFDSENRRVASSYPELSHEELKKIVLPAAKDSSLWLWTTHKFIWDAKELIGLWGFEYKGILVWNKEKLGMGEWLRMQTEFCLLGIKGKPKWNLTNERDLMTYPRREHSRKPDEFYIMIEKLSLAKNKLDIFGREKRKGWTVWGNETNKF